MAGFTVHLTSFLITWWKIIGQLDGKFENMDCKSEELQRQRGRIYSPGYPNDYPSDYCKNWFITGDVNYTITISFRNYDIEVGDNDLCNRDYIQIGPKPSRVFCGKMGNKPYVYISAGKKVKISFKTDYTTSRKGFELYYIMGKVPSIICGDNEYRCNNGKCIYRDWYCNGADECGDGSDEKYCPHGTHVPTTPSVRQCNGSSLLCRSRETDNFVCLSNSRVCDGTQDCVGGEDEAKERCSTYKCDSHIDRETGYIQSPGYPVDYPSNLVCFWTVHVRDDHAQVQIRFIDFSLQPDKDTDYVTIYDGPFRDGKVIGTFKGNQVPALIESSTNYVTLLLHTDNSISGRGFNVSYQKKGECLSNQLSCGEEADCYPANKRCDGIWDCRLHGGDEKGCGNCQKDQFSCGSKSSHQCYDERQRCNGMGHCADMEDELNCTPIQCGPHNGTFLCDNKRCIYETWKCDKTNDCDDNSDEVGCSGSTNLIIIAAVAGSLICALLLVVAVGCTCKLYNLRMQQFHGPRHETPLTRLYAEFMRRRPPPTYNEAMQTSRPYDEVRREVIEQGQNERRSRRNRHRRSQQQTSSRSQLVDNESNAHGVSGLDGSGLPADSTNSSNNQPSAENPLGVSEENAVNSTNRNLNRLSSTERLIPADSSDSSDSEQEVENSNEPSVNVLFSSERGITARWRRRFGRRKTNNGSEYQNLNHEDVLDSPRLSVDGVSVDATITSCDSAETSVTVEENICKPCDTDPVGALTSVNEDSSGGLSSHDVGEVSLAVSSDTDDVSGDLSIH